ncbi:MAG: class I SAM-dependent methyltransferase [Rhodospirillales bacterium]|nr:class I SAM-dependent methyltransferase [Rhodospirillales bacterium]
MRSIKNREFFKYQVIASDELSYSLPFLGNPLRAHNEKTQWRDETDLFYEYLDDDRRAEALRRFAFMHGMIEGRVGKDEAILDVGCNTGFFLEQFHRKGYTDLHGVDPMKAAVRYAHEHRPYLDVREGFFGPRQFDVPCNLLVFFGSITRVPYSDRLFDAIDRCARKYVLVWIQESLDDFHRDVHVGLAKKGFICIEKRTVSPDYVPIGHAGATGPMVRFTGDGKVERLFHSHFLFRRVDPDAWSTAAAR